jgi:dipeptidyl aminopeptidase/acylaminoacyl peptidase
MIRKTTLLLFLYLSFAVFAESLPVEAYGKLPVASQMRLSPDGNHIAFIRNHDGNSYVGVIDRLKKTTKFVINTDNEKFKIGRVQWANNDILLVSAHYPVHKMLRKYTEARLYKIRIDGSEKMRQVSIPKNGERVAQYQNTIIDILPNEPNHILMEIDYQSGNKPDVYKIDLKRKNSRSRIVRGRENISHWMTDQQHRVRLGFGIDETRIFYSLYDLKTNKWRKIWDYEIFDAPDITPLGFALNPNELYIRADHQGHYAIFTVDLSKKDLPRALVYADKKYDIEGSLIYSNLTNDVIGVYHGESESNKVYFNSSYEKFQLALNKVIPNSSNNITSFSHNERQYILHSTSKESAGRYYFGDRDSGELTALIDEYPQLNKTNLIGKSKHSYQARDGLTIEAYLTVPNHTLSEKRPAIIIPHGGPMSRIYGGFDWFSEFFASRGYLVLEPNFRGSSGYGFKFEMASVKNWGGAMQDDLADAAKWLTNNYQVDKNKICIVGASYGGYAALMAAAKQQDIFKCAVSFAGVSDLEYLVRKSRNFTNHKVVKKQIGNDSNILEQNSPTNFAKDIDIPVMLIHGDLDTIVRVEHSQKMYASLMKYDKSVEYIELENGNHHLSIEKNRLVTLDSIAKFLAKNLQ